MRVACVGAGPGGLYFALLIKQLRPDWSVTVLEHNPRGSTVGLGVVYWEDLREQMRDNDPVSADAIAHASFQWVNQVVYFGDAVPSVSGGTAFSIRRQAMLDILTDRAEAVGVEVEFGRTIADLDELAEVDLIVGSDGVNSVVRRTAPDAFGTRMTQGRNRYIWLGTTKVFRTFVFPFFRTAGGWVWGHVYSIDETMTTFVVECEPETWSNLGLDTATAAEALAILTDAFAPILDGHSLVEPPGRLGSVTWRTFLEITNERWSDGRRVLLGDAAHTTHFSIGSGTKLAIEDAIALAHHLDLEPDVAKALQAYTTDRQTSMEVLRADAHFSSLWFENLSRYARLPRTQFLTLLESRRSPLQQRIPPRAYYWGYRAAASLGAAQFIRRQMGRLNAAARRGR